MKLNRFTKHSGPNCYDMNVVYDFSDKCKNYQGLEILFFNVSILICKLNMCTKTGE